MLPRFLLDTHVLVRWMVDMKRLSREQRQVLDTAARRTETVAVSAISLLEIAVLTSEGKLKLPLDEFLARLQSDSIFRLLPLTYEIASDVAWLQNLRDPMDRVIVATARVHGLTLLSSDQRIVASSLVPVIE